MKFTACSAAGMVAHRFNMIGKPVAAAKRRNKRSTNKPKLVRRLGPPGDYKRRPQNLWRLPADQVSSLMRLKRSNREHKSASVSLLSSSAKG